MKPLLDEDILLDLAYRLKALRVSNNKEWKYRDNNESMAVMHREHIEKDLKYIESSINQFKTS